MVQTNSEEDVLKASKKAFKLLPNLSAAIQALTVLKAIGPATASGSLQYSYQHFTVSCVNSVVVTQTYM